MSYLSLAFSMATPITGSIGEFFIEQGMRLAESNREFAPLRRISTLHLAGFIVLDGIRDTRGRYCDLDPSFLLFFSLFDGAAEAYLTDFQVLVPDNIDSIWGNCVRYPWARDGGKFVHWLGSHALAEPTSDAESATTYEYSGYLVDAEGQLVERQQKGARMAPLPLVTSAVALRERLISLKDRLDDLSDEELEIELSALAVEGP